MYIVIAKGFIDNTPSKSPKGTIFERIDPNDIKTSITHLFSSDDDSMSWRTTGEYDNIHDHQFIDRQNQMCISFDDPIHAMFTLSSIINSRFSDQAQAVIIESKSNSYKLLFIEIFRRDTTWLEWIFSWGKKTSIFSVTLQQKMEIFCSLPKD